MRIRRGLAGVTVVRAADLVTMSRSLATLRLRYAGDETRLTEALARADLKLDHGPDGWVLSGDGREARSTRPGGNP
jgi:hypothetical protein